MLLVLFRFTKEDITRPTPLTPVFEPVIFWAVVIISAIVDLRAEFNAKYIAYLGEWVKLFEGYALPKDIAGWETFFFIKGTTGFHIEREVFSYILYIAILYLFLLRPASWYDSQNNENSYQGLSVSRYAAFLCLCVFCFAGLYNAGFILGILIFNLATLAVSGLTLWYIVNYTKRQRT
jgi:hypothetical protein